MTGEGSHDNTPSHSVTACLPNLHITHGMVMITHDTVISLIRAQPGNWVQTIACIIMNINGMRQSAPAVCSARYADSVSSALRSKKRNKDRQKHI